MYHQHHRYLRDQGLSGTPREHFDNNILVELAEQVYFCNIVLLIDVNQHVITGAFTQQMNSIMLRCVFSTLFDTPVPPIPFLPYMPRNCLFLYKQESYRKDRGSMGTIKTCMWTFQIPHSSASNVMISSPPPMKRLKLKDMRIVNKFNQ